MASKTIARIIREYDEIKADPPRTWTAYPVEVSDPKIWHFVLLGTKGTAYENGLYHGRIFLPDNYPMAAPDILFDTRNGRFDTRTKICLSATAYHPEHWQPAWGIRSLMDAIQAFMSTDDYTSIGAISATTEDRKMMATASPQYVCQVCGLSNNEIAFDAGLTFEEVVSPKEDKREIFDVTKATRAERIAARTCDDEEAVHVEVAAFTAVWMIFRRVIKGVAWDSEETSPNSDYTWSQDMLLFSILIFLVLWFALSWMYNA